VAQPWTLHETTAAYNCPQNASFQKIFCRLLGLNSRRMQRVIEKRR
jgi:hypothetical protein